MFKNALISVSDKTGLKDLAAFLKKNGTNVVSTGGTAKALREYGLQITDVSDWTGFPEVMDGRVKTLHPRIHMALLARNTSTEDQAVLKKNNLQTFDLVVVNLYPFEEEPGIETIDIGGPTLIRAAAKSHERIVVLCEPTDYQNLIDSKELPTLERRRLLAGKAFRHVSSYDAMIADWFNEDFQVPHYSWGGTFVDELRYGENPHQKASWFKTRGAQGGLHDAAILHGKAISYNNLLDLNAAVRTVRSFGKKIAAVAVKHTNPCGAATGESVSQAVGFALSADPKSVFGGIVAVNQTIDEASAQLLRGIFLECIVAPDFSAAAIEILKGRKDVRLLKWSGLSTYEPGHELRSIVGGVLVQQTDQVPLDWQDSWKVHGEKPDIKVKADLVFAWQVCANLKSNAISLVKDSKTVGLGMGQVNRVDAVKQAIERWQEYHPTTTSPVLASDAFFPFADSIDVMAQAGVKWVIQPGGSVRDAEVLERAQNLGVNIVLTGERHFSH